MILSGLSLASALLQLWAAEAVPSAAGGCPQAGSDGGCTSLPWPDDDDIGLNMLQSAGRALRAKRAASKQGGAEPLSWQSGAEPLKILFVGNSFTYGPPPYNRADQTSLNNLPRLFKFIAESLGKKVIQEEDTIGGCTIDRHLPSTNPEACKDRAKCQPVNTFPRVNASLMCTFPQGIEPTSATYSPCPQKLMRQPHGSWDVIAVNEHSWALPFSQIRRKYTHPAIEELAQVTALMATESRQHKPLLALYMTWGYLNGVLPTTPPPGKAGCWVKGDPVDLTYLSPGRWHEKVKNFACQGYAVAQGAASGLALGVDVLVPAGLAWQAARGSPAIDPSCKQEVDEEYDNQPPLNLSLPLPPSQEQYVRWKGEQEGSLLYRDLGPNYTSVYSHSENIHVDHHASALGMYLNALVFYATLFEQSPIGAAVPNGQVIDNMTLPTISAEDAEALQHIAHDTVMGNFDVWWNRLQEITPPAI